MITYVCLQLFKKEKLEEKVAACKQVNGFLSIRRKTNNEYVIYWARTHHSLDYIQNFITCNNEYCVFGKTVLTFCFYLIDMVNPVSVLFSIWLKRPLTISSWSELLLITKSAFGSAMAADERSHNSELHSLCTTGFSRMCKFNLR